MNYKRLPLFIFGLIYGFIVNPIIFALGYGFCNGIALLKRLGSLSLYKEKSFLAVSGGVLLGIILLAVGMLLFSTLSPLVIFSIALHIIGFTFIFLPLFISSIVFFVPICAEMTAGLSRGWHCAMEFYDYGFMAGLSFPFKYMSGIGFDLTHNFEVQRQVDKIFAARGNAALKKEAEEIIKTHATTVIDTIDNDLERIGELPTDLSYLIIQYALVDEQKEMELFLKGNLEPEGIGMSNEEVTMMYDMWELADLPLILTHPMPEEIRIRRIADYMKRFIDDQPVVPKTTTLDFLGKRKTFEIIHSVLNQKLPQPKQDKTDSNDVPNEAADDESVSTTASPYHIL